MVDKKPDPALSSLDDRLKKARAQTEDETAPVVKSSSYGTAMRIGVELVVGVVIGLLIGRLLDSWLDTSPLMMIIFLFVGFAAGVNNVIREHSRMQTEDE